MIFCKERVRLAKLAPTSCKTPQARAQERDKEVDEIVQLALATGIPVNAEVRQNLKRWAEETVAYIWTAAREHSLTSRATSLLTSLAIQVAQFRLISISRRGEIEEANAKAKRVTKLADKIVVDLAVPFTIVNEIISSGAQQIKDPYNDPDQNYRPPRSPRFLPQRKRGEP